MSRFLGPDLGSRRVWDTPGYGRIGNYAGYLATVYTDTAATTPASINTYDGTGTVGAAIANSQVRLDTQSRLPQFWFPDGVDTLYVTVVGGPTVTVVADVDARLDSIVTYQIPAPTGTAAVDRANIQTAIDSASAGTALQLRPGTYYVDQTIRVPNHITLVGSTARERTSYGTIIKAANGANLDAVIADQSWYDNASGVGDHKRLVNLQVDGNGTNQTAGLGVGIIGMSYLFALEGVTVAHTRGDGIRLTNVCRAGTEVVGTAVENRVVGCVVIDAGLADLANNRDAFAVREGASGFSVTDGFIEDCILQGTGAYTNGHGMWFAQASGWKIAGNHIYLVGRDAIHVVDSAFTRILGNYCEQWGQKPNVGATAGIYVLENGTGGVVISDNNVRVDPGIGGNTHTGVYLENHASSAAYFAVGHNVIYSGVNGSGTGLRAVNNGSNANFVMAYSEQTFTRLATSAVIDAYCNVRGLLGGWQQPAFAASYTPDPSLGATIRVSLSGNMTVGVPTMQPTGTTLTFVFVQDSVGGRTVTFHSRYRTGGWKPNLVAGSSSSITFASDGWELHPVAADPAWSTARDVTLAGLAAPLYLAHRGGSNVFPENTMEAFRGAAAAGAQILEMDCWPLLDGGLGVMHDTTVDRTTTSTGTTTAHSSASWRNLSLDAASWLGGGWPNGLHAPTFDEVAREFGGRVVLAPEAEGASAGQPLADAIVRHGIQKSVLAQSFTLSALTPLVAAGVECLFGAGGSEPDYAALLAAGIRWVAFGTSQSTTWVSNAVAAGMRVLVYTPARHFERDTYLALGVTGFFSDDPIYMSGSGYRLTADPFATQTWYHGHLACQSGILGTTGSRGAFTAPNWWGWAVAGTGTDWVLQGWACPLASPTNFTLNLTAILDASGGTNRWCSVFIGTDDQQFADSTSTPRNGYHALFRETGQLQLWRVTGGTPTQLGSTIATTAPTLGVTEAQLRLTVTPTTVTWQRVDVAGTTGAIADATYRGAYMHFGRNGVGVRFKGVTVT